MQHQQYCCRFNNCAALLIVGVFSLVLSSVQGDDYLKESPSFLKPCKINDLNHGECFSSAVENVFTNWRDGIPGLKSIGSIDPFHVKKVHLEQNNPNINIKLDLKNVIITGLSQTSVVKSSVSKDYNFKILLKMPKLYIKGDYRIKGSILLLRLNSTGPIQAEMSDADVILTFKANLIENFNQKFFDITSVQSNIKTVGNFHVNFGNLFGGNVQLEESANEIFNQNWRELFEIMRPVISETLDALTMDRYKKIFNYIPATYFFVDLP